ncbi:starch-binding domain-containing protein 1 [Solea senegalensis]|uniref:Starch-binding domain-containing protein 1 n=1 Tax=Solea senegalensis TaxID=28829 RepID=A0AAV6R1T5_SOLSE|nr:flocculation protein FLO11 [Solea senegalensis]KAG7499484.1 starch-binding domain-containing protein 1 [Solea senegalensis]
MSPENSNSAVAAETRVDLASLFCMVGHHGPAVGLSLIAAVFLLLVGLTVYRTVRWTRRKATTTDTTTTTTTAGDGDSGSPANRPRHEPNTEEPRSSSSSSSNSSSVESTDGVQSGMKEEGDPKVRHRRAAPAAAAEKKHRPLYSSSPASDVQMTGDKHAASDLTDATTVEQDSHEEAKTFEAEEKAKQEKEYFQCVSSSHVNFDPPAPCVNDNVVNDGLRQDNKVAPEINGTESNSEDQSDNLDHSEHSCNHFSPEEERSEAQQGRQTETCPSKSGLNLSPSQQDKATPSVLDSDVTGKDLGDDQVPTAAEFDTRPPQSRQTDQEDEHGLVDQDEGVISTEADQVKEKIPTSVDSDSPSVELKPSHLNEPVNVDNLEEAEISGLEGYPEVSVDLQPPQSGLKVEELATSLEKETDLTIPDSYLPSTNKDLKYEKNEAAAEESADLHVLPSYKDQTTGQTVNGETYNKTSVSAASDIVPGDTAAPDSSETVNAPLTGEETSCSHLPSVCQEPKRDHREIIETFTETQIPVTNAGVYIAKSVMSEQISDPDMWTLSQNQESDQIQNNEDPSVVAHDLIHPLSQIKLQPFEQSELNVPSPGVGEESGISSMTVSPDVQDSGNEFGKIVDDMVDGDPESEEMTKAQNIVLSVFSTETTGVTLRHTDWNQYDLFAVNEDTFGHEIEDSYHSAMEQFMMQIAGNGLSSADEPKKLSDMKGTFEVMEIKEKTEVVRITKKAENGAENETEELYEKTEISIMEATMDNNEWIMDSNYQFPPWMSPYIAPSAQDHTKTRELPTEDATDGVCRDTENYKKGQPMSQNINVTFRIHYVTDSPYQMVAVTGNQQELGNWKKYFLMESAKDGLWTAVVSLPTESRVEWKFVVVDRGEVCRWEECDNRLLDTGRGDALTVHKLWGIL